MTAEALPRRVTAARATTPGKWVIAGHVLRRAWPIAVIWGAVFGLWVIATMAAFVKGYPTHAQRLEVVHSLQSFTILLGPLRQADTVPGFTEWRVLTGIAIIGAIWGLMTSTGLLRGDEDAGRWEMLLAGPVVKGWATVQTLVGLAGALALQLGVTSALVVAASRIPAAHFSGGEAVLFAVTLVASGAMFLAIGAVTSQLSATRGQALMIGAGILGGSYAVRIIADSSKALNWLRWATPLGWIEEVHPLVTPNPVAVLPMVGLVLICALLAIVLADRRDLGSSVLPESQGRLGDTHLLSGPIGLAVRLSLPALLAWLVGLVAISFLEGSVARSASSLLASSPAIEAALGRLGIRAATQGYLGFAFFFVDVLLAVFAASQIGGIRDEEATGRLDNVLVQPVSRGKWLASRLAVSLSAIVVGGIAAGFATWVGTATHHTYATLSGLLAAGLNAAVPAIFVLGFGTLVLGVRPRLSTALAYGVVAWSFVINLLGSLVKNFDWLRDSSIFSHVELAPASDPEWGTVAIVLLLAAALAAAGAFAFRARDIAYA